MAQDWSDEHMPKNGARSRRAHTTSRHSGARRGSTSAWVVAAVAVCLALIGVALVASAGLTPSRGAAPRLVVAPVVAPIATVESSSLPKSLPIGTSVKGQSIVLTRFGSGGRRLLIIGGVHGDEFGAIVAQQLVDALTSQQASLPPDTQIDVITCLNPDGRSANTRGNTHGVDLNRNMPSTNWSQKLDKQDSSAKEGLTGGATAGSEPETQALLGVLQTRYAVVTSLHSAGGLVDFDGPSAEALARQVSAACGLPVKHLPYQPHIRGSLGLYLAEHNTPLLTIELSRPQLTDGLLRGIVSLAQASAASQ